MCDMKLVEEDILSIFYGTTTVSRTFLSFLSQFFTSNIDFVVRLIHAKHFIHVQVCIMNHLSEMQGLIPEAISSWKDLR